MDHPVLVQPQKHVPSEPDLDILSSRAARHGRAGATSIRRRGHSVSRKRSGSWRAVGACLKGLDRGSGTHPHLCPAKSVQRANIHTNTAPGSLSTPSLSAHSNSETLDPCVPCSEGDCGERTLDGRGEKGSADGVTSHDWAVARGLCRQSILGSGQNSGGRP